MTQKFRIVLANPKTLEKSHTENKCALNYRIWRHKIS